VIRRAIVWTVAGQTVSFIASFGTTVALARILTPREIGMFAIGIAVSGALQALAAFGVGTYVVREHQLTPTVLATAFTINAVTACLLALALIVSSFLPAVTMGEPLVAQVLRVLALVPLCGIVEFRPTTMLQRDMAFSTIALVTVGRTVLTALVSIASALVGASALSAAYGAVAGAAFGAAATAVVARHHNGFALSVVGWRSMVAFGFQTLAIGGVAVIAFRLSDFILGSILGLVALGLYNRAAALSGVPINNVYTSLARVLFVKLADDARAGRDIRHTYLRGLDMILAVLWPMLAGMALLAVPIVQGLFGGRWLAAAVPLAILSVGQMVALTFAMNYELFVLRDAVARQARLETVRTVIGLAIFAYACTHGIVGAAVGRLIDPVIGMAFYLPQMRRLSGASTRDFLTLYARNAALVAAALLAPALALIWTHGSPGVPYAQLGLAVLASGACWLAALRAMRHPLWGEVDRLLSRMLPSRKTAL
jgi:O-antigen/teichoic acid export membrane protein